MELILETHFFYNEQPSPYGYMASDAFYAELLQAHEGLSEEQSALFDAKLIFLLANHIGDLNVLRGALRAASSEQTATTTPQMGSGST